MYEKILVHGIHVNAHENVGLILKTVKRHSLRLDRKQYVILPVIYNHFMSHTV